MSKRGSYNRYSAGYKLLYSYRLLPKAATKKISSSTKQYWDKQDFNNLIGLNFAHIANEQMAVLEARVYQLQKKVKALRLLVGLLKTILLSNQKAFKKALVKNGDKVVSVMKRIQRLDFTLSKACFFIGITPKRFHYIMNIVNRKCGLSIKELCYKRYPNQLTKEEVQAILDYTNRYYPKWPLSSIRRQMKRDNVAHVGRSTFYEYCRRLGITKKFPKKKRRNRKTKATAPYEILHMDVTILPLEDGTKAYIYIFSWIIIQGSYFLQQLL